MDYNDFSQNYGEIDVLWEGTVRLDQSFTNLLNSPITQNGSSLYTVKDSKFHIDDNAQFDNPGLSKKFPNDISVIIKGDKLTEFMECIVFIGYQKEIIKKKFLKKSAHGKRALIKGFILEPLTEAKISEYACLASFQFDNVNSANETVYHLDNVDLRSALVVEKLGCAALASGSQGTNITFAKDQKKSVTIFFVASSDKKFIARLDTNHGKKLISCSDVGFKISRIKEVSYAQSKLPQNASHQTTELSEPLKILNNRLAKGEITIYEYENIRRAIESKVGQSSSNWWV